jgi:hypothetical protein
MSEHITHESYVASVRERVVETARSMLNGDLNFLEGARTLVDLRHEAAVRDDDSDFMVFVAIDSETDNLPIGAIRQHWPQEVLEKLEPEYRKAEGWAKEFGTLACESLIRRFHV